MPSSIGLCGTRRLASLLGLGAVAVAVLALVTGCKPSVTVTPSNSALNALNDAIARLSADSSSWQTTLADLQTQLKGVTDQLPKDVQTIMSNELTNLAARSIAATGGELRCNTDFVGQRVKLVLERIRAKLTGSELPERPPTFCSVVPSAVDLGLEPSRRNKIDLFGYDLDRTPPFTLFLIDSGGGAHDVTAAAVTRQTHYQATINLGATGAVLGAASRTLRLMWGTEVLSEVPVIQPQAPPCEHMIVHATLGTRTFVPPLVHGDAEFFANGPAVTATAQLSYVPGGTSLTARLQMSAIETGGDGTQASGTDSWTAYTAPPGWKIANVTTPTSDSISYTDSTVGLDDKFDRGNGGLVRTYIFVGDTMGSEAGTRTRVTAFFNEPELELVASANCEGAGAILVLVPHVIGPPLTKIPARG